MTYLAVVFFICISLVFGQETSTDSLLNENSFVFLPVIYHTPETKLAGGVIAQYNYREENSAINARPSSITPVLVYTQNNQFIGELGFDSYFNKELYHITGTISYKIFPNTYFGIGNNTAEDNEEKFTSNNFIASFTFLKKLFPSTNIGLQYDFEKLDVTKKDSLLNIEGTPGNKGSSTSGFGPVIHYDTRDNVNFPTQGYFYQGSILFYQPFLGSDHQYNRIVFDLRNYYTFLEQHVIAFQSHSIFTNGNVPFNKLPLIGGSRIFRGYFEGRFRDKHILFLQGEYRSPTWYNAGYALFAGFGDVASEISKFNLSEIKYTLGFGFRYMFIPKEKLNLRFDFGFVDSGFQFYASFAEAF